MARRRKGRAVSGILVLDKPPEMTSNSALQRAKRLFQAAKAGHTGSLDPLATGVLPLCFGEATKFSQYLLDADKGYRSTFVLGVGTDTGDAEGQEVSRADASTVDSAAVEAAIQTLSGPIQQIPPMYSALKRDGKPLYELARKGVEVERPPRSVVIHEFHLQQFEMGEVARAVVDVRCSKGTYIRTLAEDLGSALGVPAHVGALRRTHSGPFTLAGSHTLENLEAIFDAEGHAGLDELLIDAEVAVADLPRVELTESAGFYLCQGQPVLVPNGPRDGMVRVAVAGGHFLGIGEMLDDGRVAPRRLIVR